MLQEREVKVDAKRRSALPVDVMRDAGINVGDNLVISVMGPGHIVLRTRAAVLAEVRAEIVAAFTDAAPAGPDAISAMRTERDRDAELVDSLLGADDSRDPVVVQARGAALLDRLGL